MESESTLGQFHYQQGSAFSVFQKQVAHLVPMIKKAYFFSHSPLNSLALPASQSSTKIPLIFSPVEPFPLEKLYCQRFMPMGDKSSC